MTQLEKEQVQYLLTQYLEEGAAKSKEALLFDLIDRHQDDKDWVPMLEELIAAEPAQPDYDRSRWDAVVQKILKQDAMEENLPAVNEPAKLVDHPSKKGQWLWAASAAAILFIIGTIWFVTNNRNEAQLVTKYGEVKKITLQDQTEITLNSNSNLTYLKEWENGKPREVWLKGEALFKVKHLNSNTSLITEEERFVVHTEQVNVEVLGTVFNIRERRGKTEVVLEEGKVKVSFTKSGEPDIIMQPGQIVTFEPYKQKPNTSLINAQDYTAWTRNKLILTNAPFNQVVEYMEDNFGKKIILSDPKLGNRKVEGTFIIDNLDDALLVLSKALNVEVIQKGDTLFFTPK